MTFDESSVGAFPGVVLGIMAILASVWIPTLAAVLALSALALGYVQRRHSSGSRKAVATLALVLGASGILSTVLVVLVTSDW